MGRGVSGKLDITGLICYIHGFISTVLVVLYNQAMRLHSGHMFPGTLEQTSVCGDHSDGNCRAVLLSTAKYKTPCFPQEANHPETLQHT